MKDKLYTKVQKYNKKTTTVIPNTIALLLDIDKGDFLQWRLGKDDGELILQRVKARVAEALHINPEIEVN